ncbi:transposase family protein [Streptomyces sp. DH7]|uniref:transposase family protein n=1 Tax=Streptomyces sp. DH7 TaxID=2857006 RepID=UPI0027DF1FD1|nr:transposase family protein [Streptomyces sp. DH7]
MYLRHATTHDVLACWFGVDHSTITRAIGEVRPCSPSGAAPSRPTSHLRTLPEVIDRLGTNGQT